MILIINNNNKQQNLNNKKLYHKVKHNKYLNKMNNRILNNKHNKHNKHNKLKMIMRNLNLTKIIK